MRPMEVVDTAAVSPGADRAATTATSWRQRSLPVLCGCAMAGAAAVVALNDPAAPGSRFPACVFHSATGLWCPGCGLTRGFHQLFRGDVVAALGFNLFVPIVLVAVVASWWSWCRVAWGRTPGRWRVPMTNWVTVGVPVVLVIYGVLRNIPVAPFRALAP